MNKQQELDIMFIRAQMYAEKIMEQFDMAWNAPDPMAGMDGPETQEPVIMEESDGG
jgi:hypothetical protein